MTYQSTVLADSPLMLWLLADTSGTTAADATGNGLTGTYNAGYTLAQAGPLFQANAVAFAGGAESGGEVAYSTATQTPSYTFSLECWVKTTTASGGVLIENVPSSGTYWAYVVYMVNGGQITFGIASNSAQYTCTSTAAYNNGSWHHVVATYSQSSTNMVLYVDGQQVATTTATVVTQTNVCFYEVAGQSLTGFAGTFTNSCLAATMAAAAQYGTALTANQVSAHWTASGYAGFPAGLASAAGTAVLPGTSPANSGPRYAGTAASLPGGSGRWVNAGSADGPPDSVYATWTAP